MFKRPLISLLAMVMVCHAQADDAVNDKIHARMAKLFPDDSVSSITKSEISGLYEVMLGASLFYMSGDGRYVLRGDLIDLEEKVNISDQRRALARKDVFADVALADVIEFPAVGKPRETLYVYTDIDCGYCRKLHLEIPQLNNAGIAVRYLAFPRSGLEGESFDKAAAVWCSADRQKALTAAKAGETVKAPECDNPVAKQFELGQAMGVAGTPAVYSSDGSQLGGYIPAARLIERVQ